MSYPKLLVAFLAALLIAGTAIAINPELTFYQEMQQEITNGDIQIGTSVCPEYYPPEPRPEGIQGLVHWPNRQPADYSWVYAQAKDDSGINAWVHTYWSIHTAYYVHNRNIPYHSIPWDHYYYIKALRWIPKDRIETPPITQPGPFPPPEWATGTVFSPTYLTEVPYRPENPQIFIDPCLRGDAISW
ncbi:MAG: hypothetical protein ABIJ93_03775 [candidate division WOR-3 bacterium]